ncbi:uncharacterized protein J3D65DRAFT_623446, partial [Phyllosticta citribraziliensis]
MRRALALMLILGVLRSWGLALGRLDIGPAIRSLGSESQIPVDGFIWLLSSLREDYCSSHLSRVYGRASDLLRVPHGVDGTPSQTVLIHLTARFPTTRPTLAFLSAALTCFKKDSTRTKNSHSLTRFDRCCLVSSPRDCLLSVLCIVSLAHACFASLLALCRVSLLFSFGLDGV